MQEYKLTNNGIQHSIQKVEESLQGLKMERKELRKLLLMLEECLLNCQERFGEEQTFRWGFIKQFCKSRILIKIKGESYNPFEINDVEEDVEAGVLQRFLVNMGIVPIWKYNRGCNDIVFTPNTKKMSQMASLILALVLGLLCGFVCTQLPASWNVLIGDDLVTPIFNTFMGILSGIAGPMIFMSVISGICGMGDIATFGKVGQKMISRFLLSTVYVACFCIVLCVPFFSITSGGDHTFVFKELFQMILDIIPSNFIAPFIDGNPMQIIFLAIVIGVALIVLNLKTLELTNILNQTNDVIQLIMGFISNFMCVFVFCSMFNIVRQNDFSVFTKSYKLFPLFLGANFILLLFYLIWVSVKYRVGFFTVIKKVLPTYMITISTASSAAAYSTNIHCCEKQLGIDPKVVKVGIPLGQVIFMLGAAIQFFVLAICMAEVYSVAITPSWILIDVLIAMILAIAAPPVAGGALTCYTILFMQLGLPIEALGIAIALNIVLEFVATASNIMCLQLELVGVSNKLGLLDRNVLRDKNAN